MKNKIKALIFDMDGVIVDSEPIHERAEIQVCSEFGMEVPREEWENFRGKKIDDILSYVSKKYGTGNEPVEQMIERKIEIYLEHALNSMELIPGIHNFLTYLKEETDCRCALTTSGRKMQQDQILAKFNLAHFFEIVVTADDVKNGKPNPEPYLVTVERLQEEAQNCLVVEDSDNGIRSAKGAGCKTCGITTTFSEEQLKMAGADEVISSYDDFKLLLDR